MIFGQCIGYAELGQCREALALVNDAWQHAARNESSKKTLGYAKCRCLMRMGRYEEVVNFAKAMQDTLTTKRRMWEFEWFVARAQISLGNY